MNFRQIRKKIRSVNNVKKITKALELVSAVKMKKQQKAFFDSKPYNIQLEILLQKVLQKSELKASPLLQKKDQSKKIIIFLTANKGLCGTFNYNLFRFILSNNIDISTVDFITVGKKGTSFISKLGGQIIADFSEESIKNVSAIFSLVLQSFLENKYDQVIVVYNKFISTLKTIPTSEVILPVTVETISQEIEGLKKEEYLIEPTVETALDSLLKIYVEEKIRFAILNNEAGEHSARMIAMKNATDNASDIIIELTLLGNKLRQEKITNELLDITTAKESVEV